MTDTKHNNPPETVPTVFEHRGYTISLTKNYWFEVSGLDWPDKRRSSFQTLDQAHSEINDHIKRMNKQATIEKTLKLTFRDKTGRAVTFRGFNSNTSEALVSPPIKEESNWYRDGSALYPDVPWLTELLVERGKHYERIAEIDKVTRLYGMSARSGYGGRIHADHYQRTLDTWLKDMNKKRDEAVEHTPKELVG